MFITTRTSFHKPFMPYLLLLDSEGIVHYRIDKLEHKRADIADRDSKRRLDRLKSNRYDD